MMRDNSLVRLYEFAVTYPLMLFAMAAFAVVHHNLANRFRCYGLPRNVLYGIACVPVTVLLFFLSVLLVRATGIDTRITAQIVMAFLTSAVIIVVSRVFFGHKAPEPPEISEPTVVVTGREP